MPHTLTITHTLTKTHLEILPSLLCRCVASESSVFFLFVSPISFCLAYSLFFWLFLTSIAIRIQVVCLSNFPSATQKLSSFDEVRNPR